MAAQKCSFIKEDGQRCRAWALHDSEFCFLHSPEHANEVAEARRLGGERRGKETVVAEIYGLEGLGSVEQIRRLLEIAAHETLAPKGSIARARAQAHIANVARALLKDSQIEQRLAALEAALEPRLRRER